jgi:hypothetical protein
MWLSRFHLASQVFSLNNNYNYSNYKQRELKDAFPYNSQKNYRNYNLSGSFSPLIIDVPLQTGSERRAPDAKCTG